MCTQSNLSQSMHVSNRTCIVVVDAIPSRTSVMRVTQHLFSLFARSFGHLFLCLSISPSTSFLKCATKDWLMPTKTATLQVETPFLSCIEAWCFCPWDNGGTRLQTILQIAPHVLWDPSYTMHKKSHDVLNHTMHTKMSMLNDWWWTKTSSVTLITSIFPIFKTLFPFCTFWFHIYAIDHLITLFLIWIGRHWKPKLDQFKVYSVLEFVTLWNAALLNVY